MKYCGKGRECQVSRGVAECVCQRRCRRHQKLVCGTDGQLYANHCELHRTACLDDRAIAVDHTYDCMKRRTRPGEQAVYTSHRPYVNAAECTFVCAWLVKVKARPSHLFLCVPALAMKFKARYGHKQLNFKYRQRIFSLIISELSDARVEEMGPCKYNHVYCRYREKCRQLYSTPAPSGLCY